MQTLKEIEEKHLSYLWGKHRAMKDGPEKDTFFAQVLAVETALVIGTITAHRLKAVEEAVESVQSEVSSVSSNVGDVERQVREANNTLEEIRDQRAP